MKKSLILFVLAFLLFPSLVFAKEYNIEDLCFRFDDLVVLEPGDTIKLPETYTNFRFSYNIQYDGEIVSEILEVGDDPYTVDFKGFVFGRLEGYDDTYGFINTVIVVPYIEDYRVIELDLSQPIPAEIYQTGDIIRFDFSRYFYNSDGEQIYNYDGYSFYTRPQKDGKDQFFSVEVMEDLLYSEYNSIYIKEVEYEKPQFKLKCDNDKIEYGKKTSCKICVESSIPLKNVSFDLSNPNFKVSNVKLASDLIFIEGLSEYNIQFPEDLSEEGEIDIMSFDVEATKPDNYTDSVQLLNIRYTDSVGGSNYNDLNGDISVIYNIANPSTRKNLFLILLPLLLLIGVSSFYTVQQKRKQ